MLNLTAARVYLSTLFQMSNREGVTFEVAWGNKVFELTIVNTGRRHKIPMKKRARQVTVICDICPWCHGLVANQVCMNNCKPSQLAKEQERYDRAKHD